ncbi:MAG: ABC transporter permease [Actinomycetota bacterium]|nr:ABC transporter permease [Actinomycetota bacterium]
MTQAPATTPAAPVDERVQRASMLQRMMTRPELGSLVGAIAIYVFFFVVADSFRSTAALSTILYVTSTIGIMAVAVALLMIGGEFDLSAGVAVTTSALTASLFAYQFSTNVWVGILAALALSLGIGYLNGWLVMRTGIPRFLVTLGSFLMLQGINLAVTKLLTGQVASQNISDMDGFSFAVTIFASEFTVGGITIRITVIYWLLFVALATWILLRTKVGNWIYAIGGDEESARAVGVPVAATKIGLFMGVGFLAWFSGMHLLFRFNTVQSGEGIGNEFICIIAAVIGGCLLTGGYGTAIGAAIGALIYGMTNQGIVYAGWNPDWVKFFLGAMLLLATVTNLWVRNRASRR